VSEQIIARKLSTKQDWLTILGFGTVIALAAFEVLSLLVGLLFLLAGLGLAGVTSHAEIKRNIPLNVMVVIVGALSLATGLENAGVFALLTQALTPLINGHSMLVALVLVYLLTLLLTEFVTNNAAAALMFPFAWVIVEALGAPILPFALAVAFAASASFITPYGYQTNLLVHNAGQYRYMDFVKIGLPISLCYSTIVVSLLAWVYL
jgi:di/tricarboxylate transporter